MPARCLPALLICVSLAYSACAGRSRLPERLSNTEFWSLVEGMSEPAGAFTLSDNLVSNEPRFAEIVRWLRPDGGVYVGVGPEQNFSYIAALQPRLAFIVDIRRENLALHLLYKALFELAADRAEFVSLLFSRPRPASLEPDATAERLFDSYAAVPASAAQLAATIGRVREHLAATRALPIADADIAWIEYALGQFHARGPSIDYYVAPAVDAVRPSYRQLMVARDGTGQGRSFLASEAAFQAIKSLQTRNLVVPVVGNFGGPTALRRVADYVRGAGDHLVAFYASNVSVYLTKPQALAFCDTLHAFPAADGAWYIESNRMDSFSARLRDCAPR